MRRSNPFPFSSKLPSRTKEQIDAYFAEIDRTRPKDIAAVGGDKGPREGARYRASCSTSNPEPR